jgi:hypothetical protein
MFFESDAGKRFAPRASAETSKRQGAEERTMMESLVTLLTLHTVGLALLVGANWALDLRRG